MAALLDGTRSNFFLITSRTITRGQSTETQDLLFDDTGELY